LTTSSTPADRHTAPRASRSAAWRLHIDAPAHQEQPGRTEDCRSACRWSAWSTPIGAATLVPTRPNARPAPLQATIWRTHMVGSPVRHGDSGAPSSPTRRPAACSRAPTVPNLANRPRAAVRTGSTRASPRRPSGCTSPSPSASPETRTHLLRRFTTMVALGAHYPDPALESLPATWTRPPGPRSSGCRRCSSRRQRQPPGQRPRRRRRHRPPHPIHTFAIQ